MQDLEKKCEKCGGGVESQIFLNIIMKEKIWRWGINGLTKRCGGRGVGKNLSFQGGYPYLSAWEVTIFLQKLEKNRDPLSNPRKKSRSPYLIKKKS